MTVQLQFEAAGLMTSVQDLGRFGSQALGIPTSGALDPIALRIANVLVGNEESAAGLELRFLGPRIRVVGGKARVALVGTSTGIEVLEPERRALPSGQSVTLADGELFRVGAVSDSSCCYLAFAGGFELPAPFGSQSTYPPAALGGFEGRFLRDGDRVPLSGQLLGEAPERGVELDLSLWGDGPIRVVPGPQDDYFSEDAWETFLGSDYEIGQASNRMGLRLAGPELEHTKGYNIPSDGIVTGSIQVPGSGLPIILLSDRQTTGGYPKIASVASVDLPRLGRTRPGARLSFEAIDVETAETLRREQEVRIRQQIDAIKILPAGAEALQQRLMGSNLISGVIRG